MEIIKIVVPHSGQLKEFKVSPQMFEGKQAWLVVFDDGQEEILGVGNHDTWQQLEGTNLDADLVNELGKAIEGTQGNRKL